MSSFLSVLVYLSICVAPAQCCLGFFALPLGIPVFWNMVEVGIQFSGLEAYPSPIILLSGGCQFVVCVCARVRARACRDSGGEGWAFDRLGWAGRGGSRFS